MDDDSPFFCMACGAPLRESETFCSKCGSKVGEAPVAQQRMQSGQPEKSSKLLLIALLSAAWAAIALALGLYLILSADFIVSQMDAASLELLESIGYSTDDFAALFVIIGAVAAASGALAAVTAVLSLLKRFYIVALVACIISSILVITGIAGIIGLIVAYYLSKSKHEFVKYENKRTNL